MKMKQIINFINDEEGAALPEYALLVALIAVVCILAITVVGERARGIFESISDALGIG
jgi:pilus assembly protein Flp/PilA